jgi:hypothetical protein
MGRNVGTGIWYGQKISLICAPFKDGLINSDHAVIDVRMKDERVQNYV